MCLAQGHNTVTPVRLEPGTSRSRVKHSSTEPLRSLWYKVKHKHLFNALNMLSALRMTYLTCWAMTRD